jgi:serine protease
MLLSRLALATLLAAIPLSSVETAAAAGAKAGSVREQKSFDRFIVKFRAGSPEATDAMARQLSLDTAAVRTRQVLAKTQRDRRGAPMPAAWVLGQLRRMSLGADVVRSSAPLDRAAAQALLRQLKALPNVQYAEIDRVLQPILTPNDTNYSSLWGLQDADAGVRANLAWDLNNGAGTVVAVIDTGIASHSDLSANVLPGYDFISETTRSNDGDGRDSDASDPGNYTATSNSNWHGTHVAGTVAAVGNNAKGVIGVAYSAKVVPVRVLGAGGGITSDIADGLVWAAGGSVPGVPANANPAEVANMSLGGGGGCSATMQAAIDAAVALGTTVVVSAGNDTADAAQAEPAGCANVVSVGSVTSLSARSSFSNYGSVVDVSAPGSSVMSTINTGTTTPVAEGYANYSGTSMAAPHVAGAVALAQSHRVANGLPPYTPQAMETQLKALAYPMVSGCTGQNGAGIIDARALLDVASGQVQLLAAPLSNQSASTGNALYYALPATDEFKGLSVSSSGGSGNADLYLKYGALPTTSSFDCSSTAAGNGESCSIATAQSGTYYVMLHANSGFSGVGISGGGSGNREPISGFNHSANGMTVDFTSTSSDSDGSVQSRSWSFGDNTGATTANPSHTYSLAGSYTVTLTDTDNLGSKNCVMRAVPVNPPVQALQNGVPVNGIASNIGGELRYTLVVPSGASNLSFATTGGSGDADLYVKFGSAPSTSDYECGSFSPNTAESCSIPTAQAGTYHVLLYAYSAISSVTLTGSFTGGSGNVAPTANFTSSSTGLTVNFTDASSDSDGSIVSRSWNFGDGTTSTATNPSKTYAAAGTYNVQLTVTDNGGLTGSTTKQVTVTASNAAPTANFSFTTNGLTVNFTDASSDSDGSIVSRSWNFGDGTTSTSTNPSKTYAAAGTYTVQLIVTDDDGASNSTSKQVTVSAPTTISMSIGDVSISEGASGTRNATFRISLSAASATAVSFDIATANGTASAGSDYVSRSLVGQRISAGLLSKTFYVTINGDTAVEPDETFFVNLSNASGASITDGQAVGTIVNDDGGGTPPGTPNLSIGDVSISEGNSGNSIAVFTVSLSQAAAGNVTYNIATANGTALAGSDYVAASLTGETIPAGQTSRTFSVYVTGDTARELNERFKVNVTSVSGATVTDGLAYGTIVNDD